MKKILIIVSFLLVTGISIYFYSYKGHRDVESESPNYIVTVYQLEKEFNSNDSLACIKYQDKTIQLSAKVTDIDGASNAIVIGGKIFVTFKDRLPKHIVTGQMLKIKGRFLGYDELLQEFKIDQSSVAP